MNNPITSHDFLNRIALIIDDLPSGDALDTIEYGIVLEDLIAQLKAEVAEWRKIYHPQPGAFAGACRAVREANEAAEGIKQTTEKLRGIQ